MQKSGRYILPSILLITMGVIVFILSYPQLWIMDEQAYQLNCADGTRITSVVEIFRSQCVHYLERNGRFLSHCFVQYFVSIAGIVPFALCNSLVNIIMVILVMRLAGAKIVKVKSLLTAVILWLIVNDTEYVPSTQIGYVWMPALILLFLILFFDDSPKLENLWLWPLLVFLAFLAGASHEAFVIGISGSLGIYTLFNYKNYALRQWLMLGAFAVGAATLIFAPSNFERASALNIPILYTLLQTILAFRVLYLLIAILIYKRIRKQISLTRFYKDNYLYINAMVICLAMNIYLGVFIRRQYFGVELLAMVLCIKTLDRKSFTNAFLAVFSVLSIILCVMKYNQNQRSLKAYQDIVQAMRNCGDASAIYVELPTYNNFISPCSTLRYGRMDGIVMSAYRDIHGIESANFEVNQCYPPEVRQILQQAPKDTVIEPIKGEFMLLQAHGSTNRFVLRRKIDFGIFGIPLPDYEVNFSDENPLNTSDYHIMMFGKLMPLITNTDVLIVEG